MSFAGARRPLSLFRSRLDRAVLRQTDRKARQRYVVQRFEISHECRTEQSGAARAGQADGLNSRTLEIFESLGFIEKVQKEGSPMVSSALLFSALGTR